MTNPKNTGCGCLKIPLSAILFILGGSYWWLIAQGNIVQIAKFFPNVRLPNLMGSPLPTAVKETQVPLPATTPLSRSSTPVSSRLPAAPMPVTTPRSHPTPWEQKAIRGIYLSRYQITNNADEQTIRQRVRYYHEQGINTIIHGVWGNGCTMYNSEVMQQMLGAKSCPNQFQDRWLDWTIDEAHQQGMQVHAYFEKGIKIDKDSPIFDRAIANKWIVPGVDRTYARVEHYVLDVEVPAVANLFKQMLAEFVTKYPQIDAVQWDDYLGYHAELPGKVDRTASLTKFVQQMIAEMKTANPKVSFDLCHHNPYWAKRYFAADWAQWHVDRVFIQDYNEQNFTAELNYAVNYAGVAITDSQLHRLKELVTNPKIKGVLIFPLAGKPAETAAQVQKIARNISNSVPDRTPAKPLRSPSPDRAVPQSTTNSDPVLKR
jgi:Glycosyl hydrolase-like 10